MDIERRAFQFEFRPQQESYLAFGTAEKYSILFHFIYYIYFLHYMVTFIKTQC